MTEDKEKLIDEPASREAEEVYATFGKPRMVSVKMFDREYQIKSNQPELVELLADEVNREAKKLHDMDPVKMGPGQFDWAVQVAFRMALSRFHAQEAYNALKAQVETESDRIAEFLDAKLNDQSS